MCAGGKLGWLDVCWRECLGKLRGATLQRTPKTGKWAGIPGSAHFSNAAALQHTLIREYGFARQQLTAKPGAHGFARTIAATGSAEGFR